MGTSSSGVSADERRLYVRVPTDNVISFAYVDSRDRLAVSKDISVRGICFEAVGVAFEVGEVIRVTFNIREHTIVATGRVRWTTEVDSITVEVGLKFFDLNRSVALILERGIASQETST